MPKISTKRLIGTGIIAAVVVIFGSLLAWWNPLEKQQLYLSNFLYYERPTKNQVVVVSIDDKTVSEEGLGKFSSWCRTYYIPVLEKLAKYQPAVIALDILFINKSQGLCQDDLNKVIASADPAEEIKKYDSKNSHPDDIALGDALKKIDNIILPSDVKITLDINGDLSKQVSSIVKPISEVLNPNIALSHFKFIKDSIDLVRQVLPATGDSNKLLALPILAALKAQGFDVINGINWQKDQINITDSEKEFNIPLDNYQMLINFTESANTKRLPADNNAPIEVISFLDLYHSTTQDFSFLRNKIVLIGQVLLNSGDNYYTPIDPQYSMPGVMIHAQAIQTILDQAWLRNQSFAEQAGTILLLALLALAAIFLLPIGWALPLLAALIALYTMAAAPLMFRYQGLILNMVYPPLAVILAAIVGYAYRYVTEFRQKTRVAGALGQYVNEEVANKVLGSDEASVQTGGEKRLITVLFSDIRGFTSISENLLPHSLVALLNEYFEAMSQVITRNGGVVDKYEGDAIMAFFEDKRGLAGHGERAAKTALDMHSALARLKANWLQDPLLPGGEQKPEIDFRVGLSSGEAVVGNIGSRQHIQYTAMGDIVNLGSRLESANKKYQTKIMLTDATYDLINKAYECRFVDMIRVKGKEKPVKTYELICPKGQLPADQLALIQAYNKGLVLYFQRKFPEALEVFQKEVFVRWPADYLTNLYAGRCELLKRFPPKPDWDFVYKMESK